MKQKISNCQTRKVYRAASFSLYRAPKTEEMLTPKSKIIIANVRDTIIFCFCVLIVWLALTQLFVLVFGE